MKIIIVENVRKYSREITEKALAGKIKTPVTGNIMTAETFSKIFSPERIKLIRKVHKNNIKNIYQLAKDLGKPYEVVFRNIKYLEGMGLIKIVDKDHKKIPSLNKFSVDFLAET